MSKNTTPNYKLPQWQANEHVSFMGEFNDAFQKVETALTEFKSESDSTKATSLSALEVASSSKSTAQTSLDKAVEALNKATSALEKVKSSEAYVGKIVMDTISDTMEAVVSRYGGVMWKRVLDSTIIGAGNDFIAKQTYGENEKEISLNNMPPHSHITNSYQDGYPTTTTSQSNTLTLVNAIDQDINRVASKTPRTNSVGGGEPFSVLQKSYAVYIWECTQI